MQPSSPSHQPYWPAVSGTDAEHPPLDRDLSVDVAVVGAGIVGLTAALQLRRAGRTVAVIEARRVGNQATGKSTAKVTSQHNLIYRRLARDFGEDGARTYAQANEAGVAKVAEFVRDLGIDCGFERQPAYVYGLSRDQVPALREEAEQAAALGLPASYTDSPPLPFPVAGALRFDNQAQFNPCRYLRGLAAAVARDGHLFEATRVVDVEHGEPCRVRTAGGATVTARDVIVATHMPVVADGKFFSRAYPFSHPMVAAPIDPARAPEGMFISADTPTQSFRTDRSASGTWLVATGGTYKTGHPDEEMAAFDTLERFLRDALGVDSVAYRWTNEDFYAMDGVPFIGPARSGAAHLHVATGFGAWGISSGTAAGMILADLVSDRPNPWAALFATTRVKPVAGGSTFLKENLQAASQLVSGRFLEGRPHDVDLRPGEAGLFRVDGKQLAVFRDDGGTVHAVSAICTHLGCVVGWNPIDRTWDCPCHGSRFEHDGTVLAGPATAPLARKEPPA